MPRHCNGPRSPRSSASRWTAADVKPLTTYAHLARLDQLGITFITLRQLFVMDLGHEEATILLTNDRQTTPAKLITRYAQRMLIENDLSDAVRFFHMDALSSSVGLKMDFDMALLVINSEAWKFRLVMVQIVDHLPRRGNPERSSCGQAAGAL